VSVTPLSSEIIRRFGRKSHLYLQGRKVRQERKPGEAGGKLSLFFYPKYGGDMILRNVGVSLHGVTTQRTVRRENIKSKFKHG
jgi:hypothetical protein